MQNLSTRAIVTQFLSTPNKFYVNKSCTLQYNDNILFSYTYPIAFYDKMLDVFVCRYYPPQFTSGWMTKHLIEFQNQCPQAVRLPTLDATLSDTTTFYEAEIARFSPISKTHAELTYHFNAAKEYYAKAGVFVPPQAEPLPRDYKTSRETLATSKQQGSRDSYAEAIYSYSVHPNEYTFYGRLYSRHDSPELVYSGTVLARYYSAEEMIDLTGNIRQQPLYAIRAFDPRPTHKELIEQIITHTAPSPINNNKQLLVPDPTVPLSDTSKTIVLYAQRLDDMANLLLYYQRDTQAPRAIARRWSQIREARDTYLKLMRIADINIPEFVPTEEQESYLKRFGAYRTA